jgi:hypothetical protein
VHEPGLNPPLEPARSLRKPFRKRLRRDLLSGQRNRFGAITEPLEPEPEIGVLGDVERIPSADRVEYVAAEVRPYVANAT